MTLTEELKVKAIPSDRLTLIAEDDLIQREIPEAEFTLRMAVEGSYLLAVYDTNGKMLSVQVPEAVDGIVSL